MSQSAFSAFPDSLQFDQGTEVHSFRIRVYPNFSNEPCEAILKPPEPLDGFMYGYSYFSQTRDSGSKRGYKQVMEPRSHLKDSTLSLNTVSIGAPHIPPIPSVVYEHSIEAWSSFPNPWNHHAGNSVS